MDYGLVGGIFGFLVNLTFRTAVWLFVWGPTPDEAYELGSYGAQSRVSTAYRLLWRVGQLIVRVALLGLLALVVWLIYFR